MASSSSSGSSSITSSEGTRRTIGLDGTAPVSEVQGHGVSTAAEERKPNRRSMGGRIGGGASTLSERNIPSGTISSIDHGTGHAMRPPVPAILRY